MPKDKSEKRTLLNKLDHRLFGKISKERISSEEKIEGRFAKLVNPVKVRNIFVSQLSQGHKVPMGEYDLDVIHLENISKKMVKEDKKPQDRIFKHIDSLVKKANKIHLDKNFDPKTLSLRPEKLNDITRLAWSEFSFYPYKRPLTIDEFNELLKKIESSASECGQNLHLLLSSFPVIDDDNQVLNVAAYVQCGSTPKITLSAKAFVATKDAFYSRTKNIIYTDAHSISGFLKDIEEMSERLLNQLYLQLNSSSLLITHEAVQNLINACNSDSHSPPPKELNQILNALLDDVKEGKKFNYRCVANYIKTLHEQLKIFKLQSKDRASDTNSPAIHNLNKAKHDTLERAIKGVNAEFNRTVSCMTTGGTEFTASIDICLEHSYGVAKQSHKNKLGQAIAERTIIPLTLSHVVTSNTTIVKKDSALTDIVEQVDILFDKSAIHQFDSKGQKTRTMPTATEILTNTSFGGTSQLSIFPPQRLGTVNQYGSYLNIHNEMIRAYLEFVDVRDRSPHYQLIYYMDIINIFSEAIVILQNKKFPLNLTRLKPLLDEAYDSLKQQLDVLLDEKSNLATPVDLSKLQVFMRHLLSISDPYLAVYAHLTQHMLSAGFENKPQEVKSQEVKTMVVDAKTNEQKAQSKSSEELKETEQTSLLSVCNQNIENIIIQLKLILENPSTIVKIQMIQVLQEQLITSLELIEELATDKTDIQQAILQHNKVIQCISEISQHGFAVPKEVKEFLDDADKLSILHQYLVIINLDNNDRSEACKNMNNALQVFRLAIIEGRTSFYENYHFLSVRLIDMVDSFENAPLLVDPEKHDEQALEKKLQVRDIYLESDFLREYRPNKISELNEEIEKMTQIVKEKKTSGRDSAMSISPRSPQ